MKAGEIILCHKSDIGRISNKIEKQSGGRYYLSNKWEKGQPKTIKCSCCGKIINLINSVDYAGAVQQWEDYGKKCYACGENLGTKKSFPCHCKI